MTSSAIYEGVLSHARRRPRPHRFQYRIAMLYLDLDDTPWGWPHVSPLRTGRAGLLSFHRPDYLGPAGSPLKKAVLDLVESRLARRPAGPVRLLTQVRWFGYVFNPVSFYYCFQQDGSTLDAIVAEITNTPWGERHAYVLPASDGEVRAAFPKAFHVSPFFDMAQRYRWRLTTPADRLVVTMVNEQDGSEVFSATLALARRPFTVPRLWGLIVRYPFMAWRVHLGIYLQALRLWSKRTPYFEHPAHRRPSADSQRSDTWKA